MRSAFRREISGLFRSFPSASLVTAPALRFAAGVDEASHWAPGASAGHSKGILPCTLYSRRNAFRLALLVAASPLVTSIPSAATDVPLAIKGYDPVAYFTDGKPTRGAPEFEYQWDEHRYRFASAEHRDLFKADPVHYAPQFGNFCAMALALGKVVVANPENWLVSDNKLYVFG